MEYYPIRTATLRSDQKVQFDVYVPVGSKHIVYIRKGDAVDNERLEKLRERELKKLFIRIEDEPAYQKYIQLNVDEAYDLSSKMSLESRTEIIQGSQQSNAEAVMEAPETEANYKQAKNDSSRYVEFLAKEEKAVHVILRGATADVDLAQHGVNVSTIAVAIAKRLGIKSLMELQMLVLGSLLHDFGHIDSEYPLFSSIDKLDERMRMAYKRHPADGLAAAQNYQHFEEPVVAIIAEHEELYDGTGYPNKFRGPEINQMALIVSTANAYDRFLRQHKLGREEALRKFVEQEGSHHHPEYMKALISI
jgi:HD-GYP domain-containing protein (c-di-GMP phosphodiesterase class II)